MRGQKPKITELKKLHGTRKSRINTREPKPAGSIGEPPDWLDEVAKDYWHKVIAEAGGWITGADYGALVILCKSYSRWQEMEAELEAKGAVYYPNGVREIVVGGVTKLVGEARKRPQALLANDYYNQYRSLCAEFGLTPATRTRIMTDNSDSSIFDDL